MRYKDSVNIVWFLYWYSIPNIAQIYHRRGIKIVLVLLLAVLYFCLSLHSLLYLCMRRQIVFLRAFRLVPLNIRTHSSTSYTINIQIQVMKKYSVLFFQSVFNLLYLLFWIFFVLPNIISRSKCVIHRVMQFLFSTQ